MVDPRLRCLLSSVAYSWQALFPISIWVTFARVDSCTLAEWQPETGRAAQAS